MPKGINSTAIALIPKVDNPSSMADFRPISCCNTIYKCIAKIIANRLKQVLPSIVDQAQSAFVRGRSISDNILLAQDLFRNYHRNNGPPRCALKIDIRKAFDTINWDFLFDLLSLLKFPATFIAWVKACICSAMFSIKVNGALSGYFKGTRGLRQGDPLSPYLFVLVMEVLSMKLHQSSSLSNFRYHWRTQECKITHLCFADDLLLFCHGSMDSISIVHSCIQSFSLLSGLIPNAHKSLCFMSNIDEVTSINIVNLLGFNLGSLPFKFLGVPLISSKLSAHDCFPLIQRLTNRVTSWTSVPLAFSGRLILIKSILFSIQSFWCSHFILPKSVVRNIQSILTRFLWKGPSLAKYGARVAWSSITLPLAEGGLGIKDIVDWNKASILLHLTHIIQPLTHSKWARWVQTTVIKQQNFWNITPPKDCSWIWKQVLKLRPLALQHLHYLAGSGESFSLWYDPWLQGRSLNPSALLLLNSGLSNSARVSDIISNHGWDLPTSNHHEVILFRRLIENTLCPTAGNDKISWHVHDINKVKARTIWESIRHQSSEVDWHKILWHSHHIPRYSFTLWLGILRRLPTNDLTLNYSNHRPLLCQFCQNHQETFEHLFFVCGYSSTVFLTTLALGNWQLAPTSWAGILHYVTHYKGHTLTKHILWLSLATAFYKIWEARNSKLHNNSLIPPRILANEVINIIKARLSQSSTFTKATHSCAYYCNWL